MKLVEKLVDELLKKGSVTLKFENFETDIVVPDGDHTGTIVHIKADNITITASNKKKEE